ncbi:MAG: 3-phosphoshikimate 1-carboxyvinyltransferase [Thermodesulfobacteriota bacterium]
MIEIKPLKNCDAKLTIPGSKSYTHRAILISSLSKGESILINPLQCLDTEYTIQGLRKFGIKIYTKEDRIYIQGNGGEFNGNEEEKIFVGDSGTTMRFLTAFSSLKKGKTFLDGSKRMRKRPIGELLNGLRMLGISAYCRGGYPPVLIDSDGLKGGKVEIKGNESSQFLSSLLMIAPYAKEDVLIEVKGNLSSKPYIDITCDVMSAFGVEVKTLGNNQFFVRGGQKYSPRIYHIEPDASNASYFFSAAAITHGRVRVENLRRDSLQGDIRFLDILKRMGCMVTWGENWVEVLGNKLVGIEIDMNEMPDLVPTLAVTSAFAQGKTVIKNIGHLRLKESDRIHALAKELIKIGIHVEEGEDWLKVEGGRAHGAEIETYNDHRIAMSFAVAGLCVSGVKIKEEQCVNKSFPKFWETFQKLYK